MPEPTDRVNGPFIALLVVAGVFLIWSGISPEDRTVWVFENVPGVLGVLVLGATYRRFRFSGAVYVLVAVHFAILAIGAKYTYAKMPLFTWLQEVLELSRNHYDRVGHFSQGFFPAIICREILLRTTPLKRGRMLFFLCTSVCLALSALWELIEWWMVVLFYSEPLSDVGLSEEIVQGQDWLGGQGDIWDAQQDMLMALCGAILALLLLSRLHDRSLKALETSVAA